MIIKMSFYMIILINEFLDEHLNKNTGYDEQVTL